MSLQMKYSLHYIEGSKEGNGEREMNVPDKAVRASHTALLATGLLKYSVRYCSQIPNSSYWVGQASGKASPNPNKRADQVPRRSIDSQLKLLFLKDPFADILTRRFYSN